MKLEYVLSGLTMAADAVYHKEEDLKDYPEKYFNKIIDRISSIGIDVSLLYNAYTEPKHGETMLGRTTFHRMFADSGGLQMITTKRGITEELKDKVYRHQAMYSQVAMSFDEIPVLIDNNVNTDGLNDTGGKRFVDYLVEPKARETASNLRRQLEVFDEMKSETKVMIISQGRDVGTRNRYLSTILSELRRYAVEAGKDSEYYINKIYGVALSSVCGGTGGVQRLQMADDLLGLELPKHIKKNVHLLGVGNILALWPYLKDPSRYDFIDTLSFDSSSHTSKYMFKGYIFEDMTLVRMNEKREYAMRALHDIYNKNKELYDLMGVTDVDDMIRRGSKYSECNVNNKRKFNIDGCDIAKEIRDTMQFFHVSSVIENFNKQLKKVMEGDEKIRMKLDREFSNTSSAVQILKVDEKLMSTMTEEEKMVYLNETFKESIKGDAHGANIKSSLKEAVKITEKAQEDIKIDEEEW